MSEPLIVNILDYPNLKDNSSIHNTTVTDSVYIDVILLPKTYTPEKRVKGTINWISCSDNTKINVNIYSHIFKKDSNESEFNMDTKSTITMYTDPSLLYSQIGDRYQFERIGYFYKETDNNYNLITRLKEHKDKKN